MKRRDFVKAGICLGCAGALGTGITAICNNYMRKNFISEKTFMYHSEKDLPKKIRLDVCNLCQLNCAACWMRKDEEKIKKEGGGFGYVKFETFKDFIDKHPFIKEIEISNSGEIFLNPDLEKILKYSYSKRIKLTADNGVNLNSLSEKMAENLVKYKFKSMQVSIDGATPETYEIYRRGGDFNTVINNIKTINKYKRKYKTIYPLLTYKFILFGHNEHEIDKARILAKQLHMRMKFDINAVPEYSPLKDKDKTLIKAGLKPVNSNFENYFERYKKNNLKWFFCKDLYKQPQFNWDGDLFGCCIPYIKGFGLNVFKDGMLKTLNNEKVLHAKLMLSDFSVEPKYDIPCNGCKIYMKLKEDNFEMKVS